MNFLSIDVKGIGAEGKVGWVNRLRSKHEVSFLALQETQMASSVSFDFSRIWGPGNFGYDVVDSEGRSGGLFSFWDEKVFSKTFSIANPNFLITGGFLVSDNTPLNIINVYGPQNVVRKRRLWEQLSGIIQEYSGMWMLIGDFNAVRFPEDRKNSIFNPVSAGDLNHFIDSLGLTEYKLRGFKYTYMVNSDKGFKFSKIDKIIVCQNFIEKWPQASGRVLPREKSDHNPLLLSLINSNFGPKPFRWYNSWIERDGCEDIIVKTLDRDDYVGGPDSIIAAKFKAVRDVLKTWRIEYHEKEGQQLQEMQEEINRYESLIEDNDLEEEDLWIYEELKNSVGLIEHYKALVVQQKSRVQWAINGD